MLAAHYRLGHRRSTGETLVAIYSAGYDPGRFGPALQIVTDHSALLMDSVMVLLHRIGVAYTAIMSPEFRVRRDAAGEVVAMGRGDPSAPADGVDETWIHVQLATMGDGKAVAEAAAVLPHALTDTRAVQLDTPAMNAALVGLANALDADHNGRFPGYDRRDVAALLRWLADGHFVLLGYQQCTVENGQAQVDPATRLGVAKLRSDVLPPLAGDDELLAVAQATMPSYLRYGAYPYIVVVRESAGPNGPAREHRFIGQFTVTAGNANVLEIPLISRRVNEALALSQGDPSRPGQLEPHHPDRATLQLFLLHATSSRWGSPSSTWVRGGVRCLFLRADKLAHFVSCLVYLPRDRYTTDVRLAMQDILVRQSSAARASSTPPGSVNHLGPSCISRFDWARTPARRVSTPRPPTKPGSRVC